jgi:RNA polymerase sigma-70 factor (ECF subfamily)
MPSPQTFTKLTSPHLPRLQRLGRRLARDGADADDLVQETLARAWVAWPQFDASGNVGAYLARILTNTFISRRRHHAVVRRAAAGNAVTELLVSSGRRELVEDPESALSRRDLCAAVAAAVAELPPHYRCVVEEVDMAGRAYQDAAVSLGVPVGTVMSRLHRARRILRERLPAPFAPAAAAA